MPHQANCIFCKISRGEIPSKRLYEDENLFAIQDIKPAAPTHLLFIPKSHVESISHVKDPQLMAQIFSAIQKVTKEKGLNGYRVVINTGEEGGQTVFHLHVHLLAGKQMSHAMT
ncbi:MAG TPA: histidine triad nucleotide-binding protein [Bdellovibrionales bacterium]|nr:histidine triad nucleotide-binding protein [Bdellovibrionales bacterium]